MKKLVFLFCFSFGSAVKSQLLFNPTTVHDGAGEFYDVNSVKTIVLEFYDPSYHPTLVSWKENYMENTLPAKFTCGPIYYDSVAVKYKGNSTFFVPNLFNNPKLPYNIDLNDIVSGQNIEGYKKIKLGNSWFDPTFAKEALASRIYKQYLPTYETSLIQLVVNGNYIGVYVNQEDVGNQFLTKHFGENNGPFFKCEPMPEEQAGHPVAWPNLAYLGPDTLDYYESYERKSPTGWVEFLNLMNVLNNDVANIEQVLNVDRVLWFLAVTSVLSNEDSYNGTFIHNYYMYQTPDGKFQMIPWDLTESFCGLLFGGTPESHYEWDPLNGLSPYLVEKPLVYQLLGNDYFRKKYFAHIRTIIEEYYTAATLKSWVLDLQALAYNPVLTDPYRPHNMTKFVSNIDNPVNYLITYTIAGMTDVVINRKPYLQAHADVIKVAPEIVSVSQNIQNPSSTETVYISANVTNATSVNLKVTNNPAAYASNFQTILMLDNGLNGDLLAGDQIFTAEVPFTTSNDHIKYYIEAENPDAIALDPERAEYFYYHYYVDQVVGIELAQNFETSIFPNPTSDFLTIDVKNQDNFTYRIFNSTGKLMIEQVNVKGQQQISVENYSRGIYVIQITSGEFVKTEKLIIN